MLMRSLRENMRWIMFGFVVIFVLSIFGMYGFSGRQRAPKGEGVQDYAVAEIDGKKVMRSTLEANVMNYVERNNVKDVSSNDLMAIRQAVLDGMIIETELAKAVQSRGVKASDQEIDDVIKQISSQFPTIEAFQKHLSDNDIKMDALRANIGTQLSQQKVVERAASTVVVTPEEVQEFYDKGKDAFFSRPAGRKVVYARFSNKEAADKIYEELKKDGSKWDALLEEVTSEDKKESIGYEAPVFVPESGMQDKFETLKDLSVGQVAPPIEITSNDIMVVLNKEVLEASTVSFDEVSNDIKALLTNQKNEEAQMKFVSELKENAKVVILDESIFPKPVEETQEAENTTQPVADEQKEEKKD